MQDDKEEDLAAIRKRVDTLVIKIDADQTIQPEDAHSLGRISKDFWSLKIKRDLRAVQCQYRLDLIAALLGRLTYEERVLLNPLLASSKVAAQVYRTVKRKDPGVKWEEDFSTFAFLTMVEGADRNALSRSYGALCFATIYMVGLIDLSCVDDVCASLRTSEQLKSMARSLAVLDSQDETRAGWKPKALQVLLRKRHELADDLLGPSWILRYLEDKVTSAHEHERGLFSAGLFQLGMQTANQLKDSELSTVLIAGLTQPNVDAGNRLLLYRSLFQSTEWSSFVKKRVLSHAALHDKIDPFSAAMSNDERELMTSSDGSGSSRFVQSVCTGNFAQASQMAKHPQERLVVDAMNSMLPAFFFQKQESSNDSKCSFIGEMFSAGNCRHNLPEPSPPETMDIIEQVPEPGQPEIIFGASEPTQMSSTKSLSAKLGLLKPGSSSLGDLTFTQTAASRTPFDLPQQLLTTNTTASLKHKLKQLEKPNKF